VTAREENRFRVDPDEAEKALTAKTKLIILNSPANPTGGVLERNTLRRLAQIACEHDLLVLSDEPYEHILFDGCEHVSIGSFEGMKERTISAFTFSKSYAMTGWRVGYAVAPPSIIDEMEKLMEHMVSGVASMAQRAAMAAITGSQDCVRDMVEAYERRRLIIHEGLNAIDGIKCLKPVATFYAFPNCKELGMSSWDLARYMVKEHKVAMVPGSVFGQGGEGYLRLSFAASKAKLKEGLDRIAVGAEALGRNGA